MNEILLTEAEQWQLRAMAAGIEALELRLQLARELEMQAVAGFLQRHGGDASKVWRTSSDCATLKRIES